MSLRTRVLIRLLEAGQTQPIEVHPGTVIGHTTFHPDYGYVYEMEVDEFNRRAKDLFIMRRAPGHEYIPRVVVECGADDPDFVSRADIDAMKAENDRLKEEIAELLAEKRSTLSEAFPEGVTSEAEQVLPEPTATEEPTPYDYVGKIREHLTERKYRLNELATTLEILPSDLRTFIESDDSGFVIESGGWVKEA
jgi:hypothetical protein